MKRSRKSFWGRRLIVSSMILLLLFSLLITTGFKKIDISDFVFQEAEVIKVTDGDTISVKIGEKIENVRLILIDSPESVHPNVDKEYFCKESTEFAQKELSGKVVWLQKDVNDKDRYGRLLRYVWLEKPETNEPSLEEFTEKCFNGKAVAEGYALMVTYPPDVLFEKYIFQLQKEARENGKGLWNEKREAEVESQANKKEYSKNPEILTKTVKNKDGSSYIADVTKNVIKGNRKSKIYHMPGDRDFDNISIKNTVYFSSEEEAVSNGYRKAKR